MGTDTLLINCILCRTMHEIQIRYINRSHSHIHSKTSCVISKTVIKWKNMSNAKQCFHSSNPREIPVSDQSINYWGRMSLEKYSSVQHSHCMFPKRSPIYLQGTASLSLHRCFAHSSIPLLVHKRHTDHKYEWTHCFWIPDIPICRLWTGSNGQSGYTSGSNTLNLTSLSSSASPGFENDRADKVFSGSWKTFLWFYFKPSTLTFSWPHSLLAMSPDFHSFLFHITFGVAEVPNVPRRRQAADAWVSQTCTVFMIDMPLPWRMSHQLDATNG